MKIIQIVLFSTVFLLAACAPKVGSEAWCESMKEKPEHFVPVVEELWGHMNLGGFVTV